MITHCVFKLASPPAPQFQCWVELQGGSGLAVRNKWSHLLWPVVLPDRAFIIEIGGWGGTPIQYWLNLDKFGLTFRQPLRSSRSCLTLVLDLAWPSRQPSRQPSQGPLGMACVWNVAARSSRRIGAHEMRGFPYNNYTTIIQQPYNNYTTIPYNNSFRCGFVGKAAPSEEWNK